MNRDTIKMLAMATMLVNHIANVFMPAGAPLTNLCLYIGYFTAVTMCYFLVEGYGYTHSKTQYAGRLFGFAVLAQLPYQLVFPEHGMAGMLQFNMLFTLLLCFLVLAAQEKIHLAVLAQRLQRPAHGLPDHALAGALTAQAKDVPGDVQKHGGKCILLILQFDIRIGIHFDDSSFPLRFTKEARYEMAGFNFPQLGLRLPALARGKPAAVGKPAFRQRIDG